MLTSSASLWREIGQQTGQPCSEHRLTGAGRSDQQEVVAARGGDFQRPPGGLHALHLGQIRPRRELGDPGRLRRAEHLAATEMVDEGEEVGRRQHLDAPAQAASPPCAAGQIKPSSRADAPIAAGSTPATGLSEPSSDSSPRAANWPISSRGNTSMAASTAERDRQVEMAAFLEQIGRSEIDQHPARRQGEAHRCQRRPHALARLAHGLVRQSDDEKCGQPATRSAPAPRPAPLRCRRTRTIDPARLTRANADRNAAAAAQHVDVVAALLHDRRRQRQARRSRRPRGRSRPAETDRKFSGSSSRGVEAEAHHQRVGPKRRAAHAASNAASQPTSPVPLRQRQVEGCSPPGAAAPFAGMADIPRVVPAGIAMDGDEQHVVALPEDALRAVAVVAVDVQHGDRARPVASRRSTARAALLR